MNFKSFLFRCYAIFQVRNLIKCIEPHRTRPFNVSITGEFMASSRKRRRQGLTSSPSTPKESIAPDMETLPSQLANLSLETTQRVRKRHKRRVLFHSSMESPQMQKDNSIIIWSDKALHLLTTFLMLCTDGKSSKTTNFGRRQAYLFSKVCQAGIFIAAQVTISNAVDQ